jgi:hypothetical protein
MRALRSHSLPSRVVAALALLAFLSACGKWSTTRDPVEQVIREKGPGVIRVRLADRSGYELRMPKIEGDTLKGLLVEHKRQTSFTRTAAIASGDVRQLQVQKPDVLATTFLIAGLGVTALLVAFMASGVAYGGVP